MLNHLLVNHRMTYYLVKSLESKWCFSLGMAVVMFIRRAT